MPLPLDVKGAYCSVTAVQSNSMPRLEKEGSLRLSVQRADWVYGSTLTCDLGTAQESTAVADSPGPKEIPSPRSTWLFAFMIVAPPNGALEMVMERRAENSGPLLVSLICKYLAEFCVTFPNVKGVLFEYGTHPPPFNVWNSRSALGGAPDVPTAEKYFVPPFETILM